MVKKTEESNLQERRCEHPKFERKFRNCYEIDKQRLVHSESFRRLQSKTQVLQVSESDFHRNRLTHSIEVAQIGRSIARRIQVKDDLLVPPIYKEVKDNLALDLIEAICLAHDIGHPPFGHGGEIALNYMMRNEGGFEGNGQTLRIVSKLAKYYKETDGGINPTRRFILGILKYPAIYSEVKPDYKNEELNGFHQLKQNDYEPPKCYYDSEKDVVDWALNMFEDTDIKTFKTYTNENGQNRTVHKSFDCSIMDLADDISYAVHDLEDAIELKMLSCEVFEQLKAYLSNHEELKYFISDLHGKKRTKEILEINSGDLKAVISSLIWYLVTNVEVHEKKEFESGYLDLKVFLNTSAENLLAELKSIIEKNIIKSSDTQKIVKNGQIIVCELFDVLSISPDLLPSKTKLKYESENKSLRVICDYISGMTDRYAMKVHAKIFGQGNISYFEK
tara:strand:+ start:7547 stop:8890 length:1344 start_codon:yes stop_codon:yes gene_type:complete